MKITSTIELFELGSSRLTSSVRLELEPSSSSSRTSSFFLQLYWHVLPMQLVCNSLWALAKASDPAAPPHVVDECRGVLFMYNNSFVVRWAKPSFATPV